MKSPIERGMGGISASDKQDKKLGGLLSINEGLPPRQQQKVLEDILKLRKEYKDDEEGFMKALRTYIEKELGGQSGSPLTFKLGDIEAKLEGKPKH